MHSSESLHDMRALLRCGAPMRHLRTRPAPIPDDWVLAEDPGSQELVSHVDQYKLVQNQLVQNQERACWAFDRMCDLVHRQRDKNLQCLILDSMLGLIQTPIHRTLNEVKYTKDFFNRTNSIKTVNRSFYEKKGRLEERHKLLTGLLRDAQSTLQKLYVELGLYDPTNSIVSDNDTIHPHTEKQIWDRFCEYLDKLEKK